MARPALAKASGSVQYTITRNSLVLAGTVKFNVSVCPTATESTANRFCSMVRTARRALIRPYPKRKSGPVLPKSSAEFIIMAFMSPPPG